MTAEQQRELLTDEAINASILKGAEWLMSRYEGGKLKNDFADKTVGTNALSALALLHAGQAVTDERLNVKNPFLTSVLDTLREMKPPPTLITYTRSLRAQALAMYNRQADRAVLQQDTQWLVRASVKGAYGYTDPPAGATQPNQAPWDNSNSQYGALGCWAAADAGMSVSMTYWQDVQDHWERTQSKDGGWEYTQGSTGTLSDDGGGRQHAVRRARDDQRTAAGGASRATALLAAACKRGSTGWRAATTPSARAKRVGTATRCTAWSARASRAASRCSASMTGIACWRPKH
jgi:hypothetical protein